MPKTMTRIESVEKLDSGSTVVTVLGGEKVGTKDEVLGQKALGIYNSDPEHCMAEIEYEQRGGKLYLLGIENVEAPEELGGPPETATAAASTAEEPPARSELPTPIITLEQLIEVSDRLERVEQFLMTKGFEPA
jgi:hypothetical protein